MSSKFKELFQEAKRPTETNAKAKAAKKPARKTTQKATAKAAVHESPALRTRGTGRRSDPAYIGVFAYIPKTINEDVREKLFRRKDLDFSGLVENLLREWLKNT